MNILSATHRHRYIAYIRNSTPYMLYTHRTIQGVIVNMVIIIFIAATMADFLLSYVLYYIVD